jgi:hypothetical protein
MKSFDLILFGHDVDLCMELQHPVVDEIIVRHIVDVAEKRHHRERIIVFELNLFLARFPKGARSA